MIAIQLPCNVGDIVFCNIDGHIYTVICDTQTKKDFNRFFASEFGKSIFTLEQLIAKDASN